MQSTASVVGATLTGKRGRGRRNFRGKGGRNNFTKRLDLQCKHCGKTGHTSDQCWASWDSIKDKHNQKKDDNKNQDASKYYDYAHCIVAHCNLGINKLTSLSSYKDCQLLDTGATSHMTFRKDCFEELNEIIDGIVYLRQISQVLNQREWAPFD